MPRFILPAVLAAAVLAALPARGFDIIKWADDLAKREMESAKRELIETIARDPDPKKRQEAVKRLPVTDPDAIMAFVAALSDKDANVRREAASQLWSSGERAKAYMPQLVKALDDPDADVIAHAAGALQVMGMKEAELAPARKRVLAAADASEISRFYAARNLVGYEEPMKLVDPMLAYLERNTRAAQKGGRNWDKNVESAEKALERLVKRGKDRAIAKPLVEALERTRTSQLSLIKTLRHFDPKPEGWTQILVHHLGSPNARVRTQALDELAMLRTESEVAVWLPHAARALRDAEYPVRSAAVWAIGSVRGLAADEVAKVVEATRDPQSFVRRRAVEALGKMADGRQAVAAAARAKIVAAARPALEAAQQDPEEEVRREAQSALRALAMGDAIVAKAAATPGPAEGAGLAVLRARNVTFESSSFFQALARTDVELVRAFLDAGMSPSASLEGMGPPMRVMLFSGPACSPSVRPTRGEAKEIVKLLLARGADIHATDPNGNSAITEAASKGCDRELIRLLLEAGAKVDARNSSGLTAFEMGLWSGHDGLDEFIAAGYRLPRDKVKLYLDAYKDQPAAVRMVKKAAPAK